MKLAAQPNNVRPYTKRAAQPINVKRTNEQKDLISKKTTKGRH